jgi:acetyltransferase-like isoleucine patch superfamily enzyme
MAKRIINQLLQFLSFFMPFGGIARPFLHKLRGVKIGKNVWISKYVYIDENHPNAVTIGDNSTIGIRTSIIAHFYFGAYQKDNYHPVTIGNNVYIGPHCLILPNVAIGDNCVIQGGTVVSRNVPPNTMLGTAAPKAIARVTVPLTPSSSYNEFVIGLRPVRDNDQEELKF